MDARESYDSAAKVYTERLSNELSQKPLDRHLLNRFAEEVRGKGLVADLGCGPGHVTRYLHDREVGVLGVDLSPEMVRLAASLNPGLDFRVGDIRSLKLPDECLSGLVAFYSIIHFEPSELATALLEMRRVLTTGGVILISFHVGDQIHHIDDMWGQPVSLDFHFLQPTKIREALQSARFTVTESVEREPYEGAEYSSRRCYLFARAR